MIRCRSAGRLWRKRGDIGSLNTAEATAVCHHLHLHIGCAPSRVAEDDDDDHIVMVMPAALLLVWNLEKARVRDGQPTEKTLRVTEPISSFK